MCPTLLRKRVTIRNRCGLLYCGRKLLNLLPAIGEGEEEGTKEFEVSTVM